MSQNDAPRSVQPFGFPAPRILLKAGHIPRGQQLPLLDVDDFAGLRLRQAASQSAGTGTLDMQGHDGFLPLGALLCL